MINFLYQALAFIFILGAAVVIHEFGHFIVAKFFKIRVEIFSFGFGKRLLGYKWGDTDYRVSLVPLGGYVKLGGDESNAAIEGASASDIPPEEQFNLRPRYQRVLVALGGPVANILTALTIPFAGALFFGAPVSPTPVVKNIDPNGAAQVAGLQPGDKIISFNGKENPTWERIRGDALLSPNQSLPLTVERNGQRLDLTLTPTKVVESSEVIGDAGFLLDYGNVPVILQRITPNSPASEAGLQPGDRLLRIGDETVTSGEQVTKYIRANADKPIKIVYERDGVQKEITAQTRMLEGSPRLGLTPTELIPRQKLGLVSAGAYAVNSNLEILRLTGKALGQVFTGQRKMRDTVSGPIGIARASAQAANLGIAAVMAMLAFLSLSLGVFNLLPIPVLDGGAIFLLGVEAFFEKIGIAISNTVKERIQYAGFFMLLLLMVFVIGNDVVKLASSWGGTSNEQPPPAATAPQK